MFHHLDLWEVGEEKKKDRNLSLLPIITRFLTLLACSAPSEVKLKMLEESCSQFEIGDMAPEFAVKWNWSRPKAVAVLS